MLTPERLCEVLKYDPGTGVFTWLVNRPNAKAGTPAGCLKDSGYRHIRVDGARYRSGRLAWFYMKGTWPVALIDHKDRVRDNNKFDNLREATSKQNQENRSKRRNVSSKYVGVHWSHKHKGWRAAICHHGKNKYHPGSFKNEDDAAEARAALACKFFTHAEA